MTNFDPEKFREAIYKTKVMVYVTRSTNPEKERKLEHMRRLVDELVEYCDEILEGEERRT